VLRRGRDLRVDLRGRGLCRRVWWLLALLLLLLLLLVFGAFALLALLFDACVFRAAFELQAAGHGRGVVGGRHCGARREAEVVWSRSAARMWCGVWYGRCERAK
jgi:hypothetical protein